MSQQREIIQMRSFALKELIQIKKLEQIVNGLGGSITKLTSSSVEKFSDLEAK